MISKVTKCGINKWSNQNFVYLLDKPQLFSVCIKAAFTGKIISQVIVWNCHTGWKRSCFLDLVIDVNNLVINTDEKREVSGYGFSLVETIRIFCGNIPDENLINNFVYNGVDFKLKYNVLKFFGGGEQTFFQNMSMKNMFSLFQTLFQFDRSFLFGKHNFCVKSDSFFALHSNPMPTASVLMT